MKLVSYQREGADHIAMMVEGRLYNIEKLIQGGPNTMQDLLNDWENCHPRLLQAEKRIVQEGRPLEDAQWNEVMVLSPVPHPPSVRDAYAFRKHVASARKSRGLPMIPVYDEYPVFYFANNRNVYGPGTVTVLPDHLKELDFELEVAVVIGKMGRNIIAEEADQYIAGFTILNDFTARQLQREEMLLNLGPAKGNDFATSMGPHLVTVEELAPYKIRPKRGHTGSRYDLSMMAYLNGKVVSQGNMADMDWTFAELIERASYGVDLYPGDIIGSGTVGTGCFYELNALARSMDPRSTDQWLKSGDLIELEIQGIGRLCNTIQLQKAPYSLLGKKKVSHGQY
ncbi:MAG: fumarylacetoacetate hydrolase family protein [Bacteroidota bacterium]|nr:fumarylacetoacetate hydrolase family protein [Bacteroidota bacterium]